MKILHTNSFKAFELVVLFLFIPLSFAFSFPILLKFIIGFIGFIYVIFVLIRVEKNQFKINPNLNWKRFWMSTLVKGAAIAIITTGYVYFTDNSQLFIVLLNKPGLWLLILFIYSVFSVYPQELIFRTFFFQRYKALFRSDTVFIILNALLFSLAHLFFRNALVLILTFLGGLLFALTFRRTQSTLLVTIEHAIYGCWLFTVGMGVMLGFPS